MAAPSAGDTWALTEPQLGLWAAQRIDPASPVLNTGEVVELRGPIDVAALTSAIEATVAEVDAYWLRFEADGAAGDGAVATPRQRWRPDPTWRVHHLDLRADDDARAQAERWIAADMAVPVDLTGADAARRAFGHTVVQLADDETWWYARAHHLLLDGFAMSLVVTRVSARYRGLIDRARGIEAAPLPSFTPFGAFVAADEVYVGSSKQDDDRRFWTAAFEGRPTPASLTEEAALSSRTVHRRSARLDRAVFEAFGARCRGAGVSWPDAVLAVVASYVSRITGQREVVLGLPMMARTDRASMRCPTTTMNVVPLWVDVAADATLADLAGQIADRRRALRPHQRYRSEQLRRDLRLLGGDRRLFGPQVNIMPFDLRPSFGAVPGRLRNLANGPVDDLTFNLAGRDHAGGLDVDLDANPALYTEWEVEAHLARFVWLLEQSDPATLVEDLDIVAPPERTLVLDTWNDTDHPVPDCSLAALVEQSMAAHPDAVAVLDERRQLSYAELETVTRRLAADLADRGVGPGSLVGVAMQRSIEMVVTLLAITRAGAAYVPLDPEYPAQRLEHMIATASMTCLVADDASTPAVPAGAVADCIVVPPDWATIEHPPARAWQRRADPSGDDPAYVIFTSGSTGAPKGVAVPQRAIVNRLLWTQHEHRLGADDRVLQKTPFGFDVSVWEFFWPLIAGAAVVVAEPGGHRDPAYLARLIDATDITTVHFVPSMLEAFVATRRSAACARTLRRVICSGEVLPVGLAHRFARQLGVRLDNLYGPTEAAVDVTSWTFDPAADLACVPIGRPVWNTKLRILDDRGRPVPVGVPGELHLVGRQLATGYVARDDLTAERFVPDPYGPAGSRMYRTGDRTRWRPDGAVEYLGRRDGQIKLRGQRIEVGEIEAVVVSHPDVRAAAIDVRRIATGDQRLVAYVVTRDAAPLDREALIAHAAARLTPTMVPSHWVAIDELPVSAHGKLDRGALPAPGDPSPDTSASLPRSPREEIIARLFATQLGVDQVGVDVGFFDLGGHSLLAASLIEHLNDSFAAELTVADLFAAPTVRAMAARLDGITANAGLERVLPLRRRPGAPTLWCVHPAGGLAWCYTTLLSRLDPSIGVVGLQATGLTGPASSSIEEMAADGVAGLVAARADDAPIHLIGWSVGGVIAQAMAVELRRRGEAVDSLTLLDAYPGDQWRGLALPGEQEALHALLYIAGIDPTTLGEGQLDRARVVDVLRRSRSALSTLSDGVLSAMVAVVLASSRAMHRHQPVAFDGPMAVVAAAESVRAGFDPATWDPLASVVEHHQLECTHPLLLQPPNVDAVVAVVERQIGRHGQ